MKKTALTFKLAALPDPSFTRYQLLAGGDVRAAIGADTEHLLRVVADFPAGAASLVLRFAFDPASGGQDLQQRLSVYLLGQAQGADMNSILSLLLERGPFRRFYDLQSCPAPRAPWEEFAAACDVVRRQEFLDPVVAPEFNPRVPQSYLAASPFTAREDNDYLTLDAVLSRVELPATVEIAVEPIDAAPQRQAHTAYLAQLQTVNRSWEDDGNHDGGLRDWPALGEKSLFGSALSAQPLHRRDAMAELVLRQQQQFHDTLAQPHLKFHIRAWAPKASLARLLASVVAESAFKEGSYRLIDSESGDPHFKSFSRETQMKIVTVSPAAVEAGRQGTDVYRLLHELTSMAPVDELVGAFRFPIASFGSPSCIRKNTTHQL